MTSTLTPERWLALSPYLDEALGMTTAERWTWLLSLRRNNPALADQLEILFLDHRALSFDGFLEKSPAGPPEVSGLAGQTLGVYTLISQIGQGGMAASGWRNETTDDSSAGWL